MNPSRHTQDICQVILERVEEGRPMAVALVLKTEGSTPAKAGARCLFDANGLVHGTIGGGLVEAEAQRLARQAIFSRQAVVFDFAYHGNEIGKGAPICGGLMRVLVDPALLSHRPAYQAAAAARPQRRRGVLLTSITQGSSLEVGMQYLDQEAISSATAFPGADVLGSVLQRERNEWFKDKSAGSPQSIEVLVEPQIPWPLALIAGGGHVGQAVAWAASQAGFDIAVVEDRPEFARPELFPSGAVLHCAPFSEALARFPMDASTFVVIVTRGPRQDALALVECLGKPAAYIGLIGSRRKVALMRKELIESGQATAAEFDRVYAPIGLEIGAVTVPEIAISIVAQLIAVRRRVPHLGVGTAHPSAFPAASEDDPSPP